MAEQNDPAHEGQAGQRQPQPQIPPPPIPPAPPQNQPPGTNEAGGAEPNRSDATSVRRDLHWLEVLNFSGQIVLAVVGIIAACIYGRQLGVMRGQLHQMEGSSAQTDYLLCLERQQLAQVTRQAADTHNLAAGSVIQASAVTRAEAAQMKVDSPLDPKGEEGQVLYFPLALSNTGPSAALNVKVRSVVAINKTGEESSFRYDEDVLNHEDYGLIPGYSRPNSLVAALIRRRTPVPLPRAEVLELNHGTKYLVVYGRVTFTDVFGIPHWDRFCYSSGNPGETGTNNHGYPKCAAYNRSDVKNLPEVAPPVKTKDASPEINCTVPKTQAN